MNYNNYLGYILPNLKKGQPGGTAELNNSGKIPAEQLPSYVDDVLEYNNFSSFPVIGETGKIYLDKQTGSTYRWTGSQFFKISSGLTNLINGSAEGSIRGVNAAEENNQYTIGRNAFAEGELTRATGANSHAEGSGTSAMDTNSHAEGDTTRATGSVSHAEGFATTASGTCSHAEGNSTVASGNTSHAEGTWTIANHKSQRVFGEYNIEDPSTTASNQRGNYIEIVGNGTSKSARSNARTLDWNGNEKLAGSLTLGAGTNDEATLAAASISQITTNTQDITDLKADLKRVMVPEGVRDAMFKLFESAVYTETGLTNDLAIIKRWKDGLESIIVTYTQSGTVYDTDSLNSLKNDLIVTALYSDSTSLIVTDYTLSGILSVGTSVITVSYGGLTDTFDVTVTHNPILYALPTETTFNGTSDYIDTGLKLCAEHNAFTILFDVLDNSPVGEIALVHCMHEDIPWPGVAMQFNHSSSQKIPTFCYNYKQDYNDRLLTAQYFTYNNYVAHGRGIISINTITGVGIVGLKFHNTQSALATRTDLTSEMTSNVQETLLIGCYRNSSDVKGRFFKGTLYDLKVYDYAFSQPEVTAYLNGGTV